MRYFFITLNKLKYRIYLCIMRTPILKPVFRKKTVSTSFLSKKKFSRNVNFIELPARKSVTGVDVNHSMFCLFSDASSFMMFSSFCCCTIERDPFAQHLEHFYERGVLELDLLPCDKIQDGAVKEVCTNDDLFSFKSFRICSKNQKIIGGWYFYKA